MLVTNLSQLSLPSLHEEDPTEVAYCEIQRRQRWVDYDDYDVEDEDFYVDIDDYDDEDEDFYVDIDDDDDGDNNVSDSNTFIDTRPKEIWPAYADALYLGEALDKILFRDEDSTEPHGDLIKKLEMRLTEVMPRSETRTEEQWRNQMGWFTDRSESLYGLDPAEDVDESNWLEKGHFREPRG